MISKISHLLPLALTATAGMAAAAPGLLPEVAARIDASSSPAAGEPSLAEVRAATARFLDVNVALAEGYLPPPGNMCDDAAMMGRPAGDGAMGIHFARPDLLGVTTPPNPLVDGNGTHTDFREPAVLIYEPQPDGSLALVAVENLVFKAAWDATHHAPPTFHGVTFDLMRDDPATEVDEAHGFAPHYDLHVWLWRENPQGVFAQFNPAATCAFAGIDHSQHRHGG